MLPSPDMANFKLVIAGDIPDDRHAGFVNTIPTLVHEMRAAGIDVQVATTYPGGIEHHTHDDALYIPEIDDPPSRDALPEEDRKQLDASTYVQHLEAALAGVRAEVDILRVDRSIAENDAHAARDEVHGIRAELAAAKSDAPGDVFSNLGLDVVPGDMLQVGDVVLALNGVVWHRPRKLLKVEHVADRATTVTYAMSGAVMGEVGHTTPSGIESSYDPHGMWLIARDAKVTTQPISPVTFADLGDMVARAGNAGGNSDGPPAVFANAPDIAEDTSRSVHVGAPLVMPPAMTAPGVNDLGVQIGSGLPPQPGDTALPSHAAENDANHE